MISIFRAWTRLGPSQAQESIPRLLRCDRILPVLTSLFLLFEAFDELHRSQVEESDLLSQTEEELLDYLSGADPSDLPNPRMHACRIALRHAGIDLRRMDSIHRSGHDLVLSRIEMSYPTGASPVVD
ncbi:MAG: hypothetical protein AAGE52_27800 [Myxococcota bacterium]